MDDRVRDEVSGHSNDDDDHDGEPHDADVVEDVI